MERSTPKSYLIVLSNGQVWNQHVNHLGRKELSSKESQSQTAILNDSMAITDMKQDTSEAIQGEKVKGMNSYQVATLTYITLIKNKKYIQ